LLLEKADIDANGKEIVMYAAIDTSYETLGLTLLGKIHGNIFRKVSTYRNFRDKVQTNKILTWRYRKRADIENLSMSLAIL
jgi:hypothetical protein